MDYDRYLSQMEDYYNMDDEDFKDQYGFSNFVNYDEE